MYICELKGTREESFSSLKEKVDSLCEGGYE